MTPLKFHMYVLSEHALTNCQNPRGIYSADFVIFVTQFLVTEFLMWLYSEKPFSHRLISYDVILSQGLSRHPFVFIHLGNFCIDYLFFRSLISSVPVSNVLQIVF